MAARQEFDNGAGFAMPPHPQHDAFVGPFHEWSVYVGWAKRSVPTELINKHRNVIVVGTA